MAGLLIKELMLRRNFECGLIVVPRNLADQWRDKRLHPKLLAVEWDLVVFDEARMLSARCSMDEVK